MSLIFPCMDACLVANSCSTNAYPLVAEQGGAAIHVQTAAQRVVVKFTGCALWPPLREDIRLCQEKEETFLLLIYVFLASTLNNS